MTAKDENIPCSLWGDTYSVAPGLFLRALGLVYLVAFVSLWVQIEGLIGRIWTPLSTGLEFRESDSGARDQDCSRIYGLFDGIRVRSRANMEFARGANR